MAITVSVIIPFFSHRDWLEESLDSVSSQTFTDFEVILINDGSSEDVSELLKKYDGKVRYYSQENKGPAAARNLGMSKAKGKYIAFEDSDDIWLPKKLEKQVAFMEARGLKWSHTGFYYWWPETDRLKEINVEREYGDIYIQQHISSKMATPCVMIEREVIINNRLEFPTQYRNGEDSAFWMALARISPVGLIQEPFAKIRMRGSNSYSHAIDRFGLGAEAYLRYSNSTEIIPKGIIRIKRIYYFYSKFFSGKITPLKEFVAKCFWTLPYFIERVYVKKLARNSNKDEVYILRKGGNM
jgi:glycosyltransferase involved in cell wall biosynthesis